MKKYIKFLRYAVKLKDIKRSGWIKAGVKNPESVAEHVYGLIVLSMLISDLKNLNIEKMFRLAVIHDLEEAILGDLTPEEKSRKMNLRELEKKAVKKILSHLPSSLKRKYYSLWLEYKNASSKEAKIIKELDKLEMVFQALLYEEKLNINLEEFWETTENELKNFKDFLIELKYMRKLKQS
ncbi:MAG: HD domain-containing protein [Candidatus Bathyarchaeia archaeon]|nr:HD domain-containing protein [Candidatus Bathyarchaeota archaeon]